VSLRYLAVLLNCGPVRALQHSQTEFRTPGLRLIVVVYRFSSSLGPFLSGMLRRPLQLISSAIRDGFYPKYYTMSKVDILSLLAKQSFDYSLPDGTVIHTATNRHYVRSYSIRCTYQVELSVD
jgi:hypothetical protein